MSNPYYLAQLSQSDDLTYGNSQWKTVSLTVKLTESLTSDVKHDLNIIETISHNNWFFFTFLREGNVHWLPSSFNKNDASFRSTFLAPLFIQACRSAGFKAHLKGWEKSTNKITPDYGFVSVTCARNRFHTMKLKEPNNQPNEPQPIRLDKENLIEPLSA